MRYKTSSELKGEARELLIGRYGSFFMMFILISLMMFLMRILGDAISGFLGEAIGSTAVYTAISVLFLIINIVFDVFILSIFTPGISLFFLSAASARIPQPGSTVFNALNGIFAKGLLLGMFVFLPQYILLIPAQVLMLINYNTPNVAVVVAFVIGYLIALPYSLYVSQAYFLMLDFPEMSALELIKLSANKMKGNVLRYLVIRLSFIPMYILGILSFGIGLFWVLAYMYMVDALFFLDLMRGGISDSTAP